MSNEELPSETKTRLVSIVFELLMYQLNLRKMKDRDVFIRYLNFIYDTLMKGSNQKQHVLFCIYYQMMRTVIKTFTVCSVKKISREEVLGKSQRAMK